MSTPTRGRRVARAWIVCVTLIATGLGASTALAQNEGWVGRRVITKFGATLQVDGRVVDNEKLENSVTGGQRSSSRVYRVTQVNGPWLWIKDEDSPVAGWVTVEWLVLFDQAIDYFTNEIRANPSSTSAYTRRAHLWKAKNEYDIALADYNEVIRLEPNSEVGWNNRGNAWYSKKDYDKAIADYSEAIRLDPRYWSAHYNRGNAWRAKKDLDRAIADYGSAIRYDPMNSSAYFNRGSVFNDKNEYDRAITDFNEAIRLNPRDSKAFNNRGISWYGKSDYDRTIADFSEAIRLDPQHNTAYLGRGLGYEGKNQYDRAIADYSEAIRIRPGFVFALSRRANAWSHQHEYDRAIADYSEAIRLDPKDADFPFGRGRAWYEKNEQDRAVADFDEAIRINPKGDNAYHNRGLAWRAKKDYNRAAADHGEAIRITPKFTLAHYHRSVSWMILRRNEAIAGCKTVLDIEKGRGDYSTYAVILGYLSARLTGDRAEAEEFLNSRTANLDTASWPFPVIRHFRGVLDEAGLMALANDDDKKLEARCFLGLAALIEDHKDEAADHFRWVRDQRKTSSTQYRIALAELDRLGGSVSAHPVIASAPVRAVLSSPPARGHVEASGSVSFAGMIPYLNQADADVRFGPDPKPLADYVEALKARVKSIIEAAEPTQAKGLLIAVGVKGSRKSKVWCQAVGGEIPEALLRTLERQLGEVEAVELKGPPAGFGLKFRLQGRSPGAFPEFPASWKDAADMTQSKALRPPDDVFRILWPD